MHQRYYLPIKIVSFVCSTLFRNSSISFNFHTSQAHRDLLTHTETCASQGKSANYLSRPSVEDRYPERESHKMPSNKTLLKCPLPGRSPAAGHNGPGRTLSERSFEGAEHSSEHHEGSILCSGGKNPLVVSEVHLISDWLFGPNSGTLLRRVVPSGVA